MSVRKEPITHPVADDEKGGLKQHSIPAWPAQNQPGGNQREADKEKNLRKHTDVPQTLASQQPVHQVGVNFHSRHRHLAAHRGWQPIAKLSGTEANEHGLPPKCGLLLSVQ